MNIENEARDGGKATRFPTARSHEGARQTQRRFLTLSDPSKVVRVVRQIRDPEKVNPPVRLRFFITLTFRKNHLVQNNKFKGLKKVVKFLIEERHAKMIIIRREQTKKENTHFHLASNTFCTVKDIRHLWHHGYIDVGPVRHEDKTWHYLLKNLSCNDNSLSLVVHQDLLRFCIV